MPTSSILDFKRCGTIGRLCVAIGFAAISTASWSTGCDTFVSSNSAPCVTGESGKGVARSTFSNPNLNVAVAIGPNLGASSARPAFGGLAVTSSGIAAQTGAAAASGPSRWNAWLALGQNDVANTFSPTRSSGHVGLSLLGVDYTFSNSIVAGIAASWDRTRVTVQSLNNGSFNGSGYNVAPYVSVPIGRNWLFDASVGFGRNDIDIVDNSPSFPGAPTAAGKTKSDRTFTSVAMSYATIVDKVMWTGKINWVTNEDKFAAFTMYPLVGGGPVAASTLRVSQLRLGGQVAYNAGTLVPYFGLTYVRDLQSPNASPLAGQTPANDKDGWLLAIGVNIFSRGAVSGGLLLSSETGRQQVKNDVVMGNIAIRF